MISTHGFIQYFIKVTIRLNDEIKKFVKELIVESPIEENLMVSDTSFGYMSNKLN